MGRKLCYKTLKRHLAKDGYAHNGYWHNFPVFRRRINLFGLRTFNSRKFKGFLIKRYVERTRDTYKVEKVC